MALTLNTLYDQCSQLDVFSNDVIKELDVLLASEVTRETAENYIDLVHDLKEKLDNTNVPDSEKKKFRAIFNTLIANMCASDCKGLMISDMSEVNRQLRQHVDDVAELLQKERAEHNELRKKHNEVLLAEKVDLPTLALSVTLKHRKHLSLNECVDLTNNVRKSVTSVDCDKYKRVPVPDEIQNKVSRVHAKQSSVPSIIQKQGKSISKKH